MKAPHSSKALSNFVEATRYLSDHAPEARWEDGRLALSVGLHTASILIREANEGDKLPIAGLYFPFFEQHISRDTTQALLGREVVEILMAASSIESLEIPRLQRLMLREQYLKVEGGRKIVMACAISALAHNPESSWLQSRLEAIQAFAHTVPELEKRFLEVLSASGRTGS